MITQKVKQIKRSAFTLIELVIVIVILGIVSMIATDIIANMYKGYIQTKIVNDLEQKTEMLIDQVAKRLQYRVKDSMIMRESGTNNFQAINEDANTSNYDMVEWIGYDNEGFLGEHNGSFSVPGWSGFIDVNNTNTTSAQVVTAGSNLNFAENTIAALSNGDVNLTDPSKHSPAIIFKCPKSQNDLSLYGWDYTKTNLSDHNYTLSVQQHAGAKDILDFNPAQVDANRSICAQYHMAWSAYAIVPEGLEDDFNLTLKYNYQPWHGDGYDNEASSSLLAEHVTTFRVMQVGQTLRVKVCIQDGNITGRPVGFCKEKAIL